MSAAKAESENFRRQSDLFEMSSRISRVEENQDSIGAQLAKHVQECAANQKKVLLGVIAVLLWTVTHSPEAVKLFGALFP